MRDIGLADRIRAKGVRVVEIAGWKTRGNDGGGYPTFRPIGAVHHHTAGSANGATPSLATNIYGRPDVPGPLAQVMQSREPDGRDIAYVIASGKCNHGGVGTWTGPAGTMNSNYESEGLEVEHTGYGTVPAGRHEISARIIAAMLEAPGSSRNAGMCCEHFEYARPLGRKIDFRELDPYTAGTFRQRVGYWIGRTINDEDDIPTTEDTDDMIIHFYCDGRPARTAIDGVVTGWRTNTARAAFVQGVKNAKQDTVKLPTQADYEAFSASFLQGQDLDRLNEALDAAIEDWSPLFHASAMRLQAIVEIEAREEQRDAPAG